MTDGNVIEGGEGYITLGTKKAYKKHKKWSTYENEKRVVEFLQKNFKKDYFFVNYEFDDELVMTISDRIKSPTLKAVCESKNFTPKLAFKILFSLLYNLLQMCSKGLIYQDISPTNIFWVTASEKTLLIDFGTTQTITQKHFNIGTTFLPKNFDIDQNIPIEKRLNFQGYVFGRLVSFMNSKLKKKDKKLDFLIKKCSDWKTSWNVYECFLWLVTCFQEQSVKLHLESYMLDKKLYQKIDSKKLLIKMFG